jgi:phenylpropionate dioxygenase-like ring-hydroxylating dioxygenase large terminal subunit
MRSRREIFDILQSRKKFFSLPQALYNDPACFAADIEGIFERQWLFAGVSCQIPKPGDYFTIAIGKTSIIVIRDRSDTIRAFHNTCRHRGSKLCDAEQGHLSSIVCPYHLWTYDFTGKLRSAGRMHAEFDASEFGLVPVHLVTVGGTIYICLADEAPDFAPYKTALARYLAPYELPNAKLAHLDHVRIRGNWKLTLENSRECFHCPTGHPELARSFITVYSSRGIEGVEGIDALNQRCEASGVPWGDTGRDTYSEFRISRLPLLDDCVSITMDGKPAVSKRLGSVPDGDFGSVAWAHFPTTFNHVLSDYAFHVRMLPIGPEESLLTGYWLVHPDAVEGRDYDLARLVKVWDDTNKQDRDLIERNQHGVNSSGYRPGPYSQETELGVIRFVDWYCDTMTDFLGSPKRRVIRAA